MSDPGRRWRRTRCESRSGWLGCLPCYTTSTSCWSDNSSIKSSPALHAWASGSENTKATKKKRMTSSVCIGGVTPCHDLTDRVRQAEPKVCPRQTLRSGIPSFSLLVLLNIPA
ncbi:hypothetical protein BJX96DRAFT_135387 [Aspergillus floccosus]